MRGRNNVRRSWEGTLGTFEEMLQRYPKTEANFGALEIERLAASLGIDIVPRWITDRPRPSEESVEAFNRVKRTVLGEYLRSSLEQPNLGVIANPPESLTAYVEQNAAAFDALTTYLSSVSAAEAPVWESDFSKLYAAPIPNLAILTECLSFSCIPTYLL